MRRSVPLRLRLKPRPAFPASEAWRATLQSDPLLRLATWGPTAWVREGGASREPVEFASMKQLGANVEHLVEDKKKEVGETAETNSVASVQFVNDSRDAEQVGETSNIVQPTGEEENNVHVVQDKGEGGVAEWLEDEIVPVPSAATGENNECGEPLGLDRITHRPSVVSGVVEGPATPCQEWSAAEDAILLRFLRRKKKKDVQQEAQSTLTVWERIEAHMTELGHNRNRRACVKRAKKLKEDWKPEMGSFPDLPPSHRAPSKYTHRSWTAQEEQILLHCLGKKELAHDRHVNYATVGRWMKEAGWPRTGSACAQRVPKLMRDAEFDGELWEERLKRHARKGVMDGSRESASSTQRINGGGNNKTNSKFKGVPVHASNETATKAAARAHSLTSHRVDSGAASGESSDKRSEEDSGITAVGVGTDAMDQVEHESTSHGVDWQGMKSGEVPSRADMGGPSKAIIGEGAGKMQVAALVGNPSENLRSQTHVMVEKSAKGITSMANRAATKRVHAGNRAAARNGRAEVRLQVRDDSLNQVAVHVKEVGCSSNAQITNIHKQTHANMAVKSQVNASMDRCEAPTDKAGSRSDVIAAQAKNVDRGQNCENDADDEMEIEVQREGWGQEQLLGTGRIEEGGEMASGLPSPTRSGVGRKKRGSASSSGDGGEKRSRKRTYTEVESLATPAKWSAVEDGEMIDLLALKKKFGWNWHEVVVRHSRNGYFRTIRGCQERAKKFRLERTEKGIAWDAFLDRLASTLSSEGVGGVEDKNGDESIDENKSSGPEDMDESGIGEGGGGNGSGALADRMEADVYKLRGSRVVVKGAERERKGGALWSDNEDRLLGRLLEKRVRQHKGWGEVSKWMKDEGGFTRSGKACQIRGKKLKEENRRGGNGVPAEGCRRELSVGTGRVKPVGDIFYDSLSEDDDFFMEENEDDPSLLGEVIYP